MPESEREPERCRPGRRHPRSRRPRRRRPSPSRSGSSAPSSRTSSCATGSPGEGLPRTTAQSPNKGGTVSFAGVRMTLTDANHSSSTWHDGAILYPGESTGVVIALEDGAPTVYFAGDTNVFGDMALIERIYAPDVAVLPIGDHFTMGPERGGGRRRAGRREPRCVPSHYGTFPLLTRHAGRPRPLLAPGVELARARPRARRRACERERWFGATGRRVPEHRARRRSAVPLDDVLLLDGVDDETALRAAHADRDVRWSCARATPTRCGRALARPEVSAVRRALDPERCSTSTCPSSPMASPIVATYSICACDLAAGQWGVATQSKFLAVGSVVPWAAPGRRRDRDAVVREPALRARRARAAAHRASPPRRSSSA